MAIISNRCQTAKRLTESDLWRDAVRTIDSADLPTKAYLSAITVTNISKSFYLQDGGKNQLAQIKQNYVTVTLCIRSVVYVFVCWVVLCKIG